MPNVLLATDADWIFDEVDAALGDETTTVHRVRKGTEVLAAAQEVQADLVILDEQIGNMGGISACMAIRHDEAAHRLPITAVMILLDRAHDTFLAKRADADGWLVKPLDAIRLSRAARTLLEGYAYYEGVDEETSLAAGEPAEPVEESVEPVES